mgnify:CR=1 FL=1
MIFSLITIVILYFKSVYKHGAIGEIPIKYVMYLMVVNIIMIAMLIGLCVILCIFLRNRKGCFEVKSEIMESSKKEEIDYVTGISNVNKFLKDADALLKEKNGRKFVFAHYDIDKFKMINDNFGYKIGDKILAEIGTELSSILKDSYLYARSYADNFLVLFEYDNDDYKDELVNHINDISNKIEQLSIWTLLNITPVITTGIYFIEDGDYEIRVANDMAKLAKKDIKGKCKSGYAIYNEKMRKALIDEKKIENDMYDALKYGQFKIYLQPKIDLENGNISGAEALVRWEHSTLGFLSPIMFIPTFEKNGFIVSLDVFVFEEVCKYLREWLDKGYSVVPVSVNVSRVHFRKMNFVSEYKRIKKKYNIPDNLIEIEITESVVFGNLNDVFAIMKEFKDSGFNIGMDDFGSGYSSLGLLREMPLDTLKLDKVFLSNIEDYNAQIIVNNVVNIANNLNLNVVSEGVETSMQVDFLRDIGCNMAQGYIFSRPIPVDKYVKLIRDGKKNFLTDL